MRPHFEGENASCVRDIVDGGLTLSQK